MILRIAASIAVLYTIVAPASAQSSCPTVQEVTDLSRTNDRPDVFKTRELARCIKELRAATEAAHTANEMAWAAFRGPLRLVEQMPVFDHAHNTCDDVAGVLKSARHQLRVQLGGGDNYVEHAGIGIDALMKHFIKADAWQVFFTDKAGWRRIIEQKSTIQFALRCLTNVKPLLEKSFDVKLAAQAMQWYAEDCARAEKEGDAKKEDHPDCTVKTFPAAFKAHYGIDATESHAYVLGWLRRRHMEGGAAVVALLQTTALMFAKELEVGEQVTSR